MELDGLSLDHLGLERLDTQTVQCGGTVKQYGVTLHYIFQDIPDDGVSSVNNFLGALYGLHDSALNQFADYKRLVKFCSHEFRQTTLAHLQLGTNNDNRTGRIVYTLTEKVLTETSLFTLEGVRERLQRTVGVGLHCTALAAVVKQAIHSFLKHALFITQNYFRCLDFHQSLQTIIADNYSTIKIIQVAGCETTAIKSNQRTQFGWNNRQNTHDHPLWLVAFTAVAEAFHYLQTLQRFSLALLCGIATGSIAELI